MERQAWLRMGVLLTVGWWVVATALYFSQVDLVLSDGVFHPSWVYTWRQLTLGRIMLFDEVVSYGCGSRYKWCAPVRLDITGYCTFLSLPVIFGWFAGFYGASLRGMFANTPVLPRSAWGRAAAAIYVAMLHWLLWIALFDSDKEVGLAVLFWLELLSFPVGLLILAVFWFALHAVIHLPMVFGDVIVIWMCLAIALAGYLQWFVALPGLYRRKMGARRSLGQEARRAG
jgi:hypothetical protein